MKVISNRLCLLAYLVAITHNQEYTLKCKTGTEIGACMKLAMSKQFTFSKQSPFAPFKCGFGL